MKLAIHAIYYHPEVGGMESHIKDLAEELVSRNHQVHIVCGSSLPGLPHHEVIDGVQVTRTKWFGRNQVGWARYVMASMETYTRVACDADVLHGQGFPCALATRSASRKHRIPNVVTVHSSHFLRLARRKALRPIFRYLFNPADHMLAPSEQIAEAIRTVAPGRQVECYVNSVNTKKFRRVQATLSCPGKSTIVCPRRLVEKNGVRFAVQALPHILKHKAVHLYMAGPGPLEAELRQLASDLGVAESVTFLGGQKHDSMPGILSSADVILIPSLMEATSIAALESMACERTIAASDVGGLPEIIDEKVGVLFKPGDPTDLAEKVVALLGMDRESMGREARRRVEDNWSASRLADHHLDIYRRLTVRNDAGRA